MFLDTTSGGAQTSLRSYVFQVKPTSMSVAEGLANFLDATGTHVFCVTGGYAQYLNKAFGERDMVTYTQTEQAAGYAAYAFAKQTGKAAVVCVTAGCGATNTLTAVVDAYQDSVPVFFVSGQVNQSEVALSQGTRHHMGAWCDIVSLVRPTTKAAEEPATAAEALEVIPRLYQECLGGRPGPVWLSLPLDVQRALLPSPLPGAASVSQASFATTQTDEPALARLLELLDKAERPVVLVGGGARAMHEGSFRALVEAWGAPCLFTFMGVDLLETDHPLYCGRPGVVGDRCGNFVMQNADLIVALGSRVAGMVVGYNRETFARDATLVAVNTDPSDLRLPRERDFAVQADLRAFASVPAVAADRAAKHKGWLDVCNKWKRWWFRDAPPALEDGDVRGGPYEAMQALQSNPQGAPTTYVHASGSTYNIVWHMLPIGPRDRFICSSQGDMGFELPAVIGIVDAAKQCPEARCVVAFMGEASFHFNVQELQTLQRMDRGSARVKLVVFDNDGLQSIALSQKAAFGRTYGSDADTGAKQASVPAVCEAFRVACCSTSASHVTPHHFQHPASLEVLHVRCAPQQRHPKLAVVYDAQGKPLALPLEDMEPLLPWEQFKAQMIVKPLPRPTA